MSDMELAEEIGKLIANKRGHVKMMSGGDVTCIHVHLLEQIIAALRRGPVPLKLLASAAGFALIPTSVLSNLQTLEDWHNMTGDAFRAKYGREYDEEQILSLFREAHDSINAERPPSGEMVMLKEIVPWLEAWGDDGFISKFSDGCPTPNAEKCLAFAARIRFALSAAEASKEAK